MLPTAEQSPAKPKFEEWRMSLAKRFRRDRAFLLLSVPGRGVIGSGARGVHQSCGLRAGGGKTVRDRRSAAFAHSFGRREGDSLAYRWHLYRGKPLAVTAPYAYANRWGLSLAGPRNNERGRREAKNTLIGARIYT